MRKIEVKVELGDEIVTREHGRRLFEMIARDMEDPPVIVDFDGLQVTSVSFFDEAFGQLALQHGEELLNDRIQLANIDRFDAALVKDIIISRGRQRKKRATGAGGR